MAARSRTRVISLRLVLAAVVAASLAVVLTGPASASGNQRAAGAAAKVPKPSKTSDAVPLCPEAPPGQARCFSLRRTDVTSGKGVHPALVPSGYGPGDLTHAYAIPANGGAGQTVAIIDAFDDPNAEADLAIYRTQYGLSACTTLNGCFAKVDQRGGSTYPPPDAGWAGEISLDIDMVSAIAPAAHILLVEADDNSNDNLGAAVTEAVALGARFVSNSYGSGYDSTPGSGEDPSEVTDLDGFYNHPGVAVVASSGDSAYGVAYPAASQYVTAVGGTSLVPDGSARGWSESVWNNAFGGPGSGCSLYEAKPSWQTDSGCAMRTVADVSAVADPETGVAVYDTYGASGWQVFGGTSASAPIIAGVYADADTPTPGTYPASYLYDAPGALNDVTTGNNGSCLPAYFCTAEVGYDGPTGLGTPNGVAAFTTGPHGQITGTVTNSSTHAAIVGASVTAGGLTGTTDASGAYHLTVPIGTYDVTASAYGYNSGTVHGIVVTDGATTTANIALVAQPTVTLSGKVTDASGHGWPVYATITVDGVPGGPVYTNPYTGKYTLRLLTNATYSVHVNANYPGYQPQSQSLHLAAVNVVDNIGLKVDADACDAPGYVSQVTGTTQTFDATTTPAGWTVTNNTAAGGWVFNDPHPRGNLTGGSGGFAIIDSDFLGIGNTEDTSLVSPVTNLSSATNPRVEFDSDYHALDSIADVDLSVDGGSSWTNVWERAETDARGPTHVFLPLPAAAGHPAVQVRFHYVGTWAWWWEVDNVFLGDHSCDQVTGGLLAGHVTSANPAGSLVGAAVTSGSQPADNTVTMATPADPNIADGFYWMFSSLVGKHGFTASMPLYSPRTKQVKVAENATTKVDFSLASGRITVSPMALSPTLHPLGLKHIPLTVRNVGGASATVNLSLSPAVGWLTLSKTSFTLAKGAQTTVTATVNAASPDVTGPGTYLSSITVSTNTPTAVPPVPVTLTVSPT